MSMFERFTDRARKVMALANLEAQRFNHEYIGTEHVMLAIVKEGNSVATNVIKNLDVDPRKVRLEVEKLLKGGPDLVTMGKLPMTAQTKNVIQQAGEHAESIGHNYIGTEHLLLALLCCEGIAGTALLSIGLTHNSLRNEIENLTGAKQSAQPAPAKSRAEMIEAAAKVGYELSNPGYRWGLLNDDSESIAHWHRIGEAQLLGVGAIQPLPKPAPVEAKAEQSEHQRVAEKMVQASNQSSRTIVVYNPLDDHNFIYINHIPTHNTPSETINVLRKWIASALAARDAAHQAAMENLKAAMKATALKWLLTDSGQDHLTEALDAVPLTTEVP